MKYKILHTIFILSAMMLQAVTAQTNFTILFQPYSVPNLPGLQSFAAAQYNGKWIFLGGRKDGLHLRQPNASFLSSSSNTNIYVVDPVTTVVWTASVNSLPAAIHEQLQSTNMSFCYEAGKLYLAGGYGYSATINNHKTYASMIVVDLPGLVNAVINGSAITPYFRQLNDNLFAVAGGQMAKLGDMFLLVGGHQFDGRYNPNNGPSFTQAYTNQIRKFKLADNGTTISLSYQSSITDATELRRRDYNMAPQVFPDRRLGYTAFSGVFQSAVNLPFLNTVDIDTIGYSPNNTFNQLLNHYHSGKIGIYDSIANSMHTIFFGGMAQYYYDAGGNLVQDNQVPFVSTVGKVTRNANGSMTETRIGDLPGLQGTGAELLINHSLPLYSNEVIKLNAINQDTVMAGYLIGGIQSTAPNIFFVNTGTQSVASNTVYKILLVKTTTIPVQLIFFRGRKQSDEVLLEWKTALEYNHSTFEIERSVNGETYVSLGHLSGSGNSNSEKTYSFRDMMPAKGLNYYRLKIISVDGKFTYSNVALIRFGNGEDEFLVYPNPVKDKIVIEFSQIISGNLGIKIFDINNRVVSSQSVTSTNRQLNINTASLPKGVYILQINMNNKIYNHRFIKD